MKKLFIYGQKTAILILCILDITCLIGAIHTGKWHLWIFIVMISTLASSIYFDLKNSKNNQFK